MRCVRSVPCVRNSARARFHTGTIQAHHGGGYAYRLGAYPRQATAAKFVKPARLIVCVTRSDWHRHPDLSRKLRLPNTLWISWAPPCCGGTVTPPLRCRSTPPPSPETPRFRAAPSGVATLFRAPRRSGLARDLRSSPCARSQQHARGWSTQVSTAAVVAIMIRLGQVER